MRRRREGPSEGIRRISRGFPEEEPSAAAPCDRTSLRHWLYRWTTERGGSLRYRSQTRCQSRFEQASSCRQGRTGERIPLQWTQRTQNWRCLPFPVPRSRFDRRKAVADVVVGIFILGCGRDKRVPPGADEFISVVVAVEVANPQMSLLYESAASCLWQAP